MDAGRDSGWVVITPINNYFSLIFMLKSSLKLIPLIFMIYIEILLVNLGIILYFSLFFLFIFDFNRMCWNRK